MGGTGTVGGTGTDPAPSRLARPVLRPLRPLVRSLRRATGGRRLVGARTRVAATGVALTFDDGPHPRHTHEVLDVLARAGVHATFFVVGRNVRRHRAVIDRIAEEGHALASHSMTHTDPWELSALGLWRDYRAGHLELCDAVGRDVRLFRPPKGFVDRRGALAIRAARLRTYIWSLDAADWEPTLRPDEVVERLGIPRHGDIVLLHDAIEGPLHPAALDRSAMIAGLETFLARAREAGILFVRLDEDP
jgi:peptidoglycan-N-acetylglucosamine deacetylase